MVCLHQLDICLQQDSAVYKSFRIKGSIGPMRVQLVAEGAFAELRERIMEFSNTSPNTFKMHRVLRRKEYADFLLGKTVSWTLPLLSTCWRKLLSFYNDLKQDCNFIFIIMKFSELIYSPAFCYFFPTLISNSLQEKQPKKLFLNLTLKESLILNTWIVALQASTIGFFKKPCFIHIYLNFSIFCI